MAENSQFMERYITQFKGHGKFIEEASQREEKMDDLIKKQENFYR